MSRGVWIAACLLAAGIAAGKEATPLTLPKGARVGVINMMDAEVTHLNTGKVQAQTFLKTRRVGWHPESMLMDAVGPRLTQAGLILIALAPGEALARDRDDFFVNNSVAKGLPRECARELAQLAAAEHLDAMILLAPALNNSAQAAGGNRRGLPDYLRGWGFVTTTEGAKPSLFNVTQLLLIRAAGDSAVLQAREWGGGYTDEWLDYVAPPDLKQMPGTEVDKLQPVFARILARQADKLLESLQVGP